MKPIAQVEHDLIVNFAHNSYLPMLKTNGVIRQRLELIYDIDSGGLDTWVREKVAKLLRKAAALRASTPAVVAGVCVARIEAALRGGNVQGVVN